MVSPLTREIGSPLVFSPKLLQSLPCMKDRAPNREQPKRQTGEGEKKERDIARVNIDPTRIEENRGGGVYSDYVDANKI